MNENRQNDKNKYNFKKTVLETDWERLIARLKSLEYQARVIGNNVVRTKIANMLNAVQKNNPNKKILRSYVEKADELEQVIRQSRKR